MCFMRDTSRPMGLLRLYPSPAVREVEEWGRAEVDQTAITFLPPTRGSSPWGWLLPGVAAAIRDVLNISASTLGA